MPRFFCSFVRDKFLGGCVVHAGHIRDALDMAWLRRCNPGGGAEVREIPEHIPLPDKLVHRLLTWDECEQVFTILEEALHS